jgi:sialidase-1
MRSFLTGCRILYSRRFLYSRRWLLVLLVVLSDPVFADGPKRTDLFVGGEGGYHTYRIPSLLVTAKGALLVFCEGRRDSGSDDGNNDVLLRRSTNGGESWQADATCL